jgi:hypothetical protein
MTTAQVGYLPVHRWVKHVLGSTHTTVVVTVAWAVKPRQNIVYLSAELNRLCRICVSTYISIRDLSPVGGLILPLYSVVAHRNDTFRVQSI